MVFGKKKKEFENVESSVQEVGGSLKIPVPPKEVVKEEKDEALYKPESFSSARHGVFEAEVCTLLVAVAQRLDAVVIRLDAQGKLLDKLIEVAQ